MGRQRWTSRLTVEQCLPLTVESFRGSRIWASPTGTVGAISWSDSQGLPLGKIEYSVQNDADGLAICIRRQYARLNSTFTLLEELRIPITTTRPHLGGKRQWFLCPIVHDRQPCGRRVGRLYLPPGAAIFGCRHCHNLTYQSTRVRDKHNHASFQDLLVELRGALAVIDAGAASF